MTARARRTRWLGALALAVVFAAAPGRAADVPAGAAGNAPGPPPGGGPPPAKAGDPAAPQEPVRISADQVEYFNEEGIAVFTGKVVATQADATLGADRMEVGFTKAQQPEKSAGGLSGAGAGRTISTITATGAVSFRQVDAGTKKERYATGEKAVYDQLKRTVTMTGKPRLWEDKNVIDGEEMTFFVEDKKVVVKGKVNLIVYPQDLKEADAPK